MVCQNRFAWALCAILALLPACGEPEYQTKLSPPLARLLSGTRQNSLLPSIVTRSVSSKRHVRSGSWMDPGAKKRDLLYVSSYGYNGEYVYVYTYPGGEKQGMLTGFELPSGECVDKSGNVFITNYNGADILEYAHGGTQPIAVLKDEPYSHPLDCSVDPTNGDLAVNNLFGSNGTGDIAIYRAAQGVPSIYSNPTLFEYFACGYDNSGNLFVAAYDNNLKPKLAELQKGSAVLREITLPKIKQKYGLVGGIQWDGSYVTVGNVDDDIVYRLRFVGSRAKIVGSTPLTDGNHVDFFSIPKVGAKAKEQHLRIVGPDYDGGDVKIWEYPAGGMSIKTITGVYEPVGTAVSLARK